MSTYAAVDAPHETVTSSEILASFNLLPFARAISNGVMETNCAHALLQIIKAQSSHSFPFFSATAS
jgi:hypothetical protein